MQKFMVGLAMLLTSLSVFAESEMGEIRMEDFPKKVRKELIEEKIKNNCAARFYRDFRRTGTTILKAKLEWLADVMCDNNVVYRHFLTTFFDHAKYRPVVGIPLLLNFQGATNDELGELSLLINKFFIMSEFIFENTNIYDLNSGTMKRDENVRPADPAPLDSGRQNIFHLDIDRWIKERESNYRGELLQWMGHWIREKEGLTIVKVASKYDAAYYEAHGHHDVAVFLQYFKQPIHFNSEFNGDKPRARTCNELL